MAAILFPAVFLFIALFGEVADNSGFFIGVLVLVGLLSFPAFLDRHNDNPLLNQLHELLNDMASDLNTEVESNSPAATHEPTTAPLSSIFTEEEVSGEPQKPGILFVGGLFLVFAFFMLSPAVGAVRLWFSHRKTTAIITKMPSRNHGVVNYQFEVDGVPFKGESQPSRSSSPDPVAAGQTVHVFYWSSKSLLNKVLQEFFPL